MFSFCMKFLLIINKMYHLAVIAPKIINKTDRSDKSMQLGQQEVQNLSFEQALLKITML